MAHEALEVIKKKYGKYVRFSRLVYINDSAKTNSFIPALKISDRPP